MIEMRSSLNPRVLLISALLLLSAATVPLHAEVMDKEPSMVDNWVVAIGTGGLALVAWRWRRWLGALISILFALVATNVLFELRDPFVGPAIRDEAGERYVWHFYASVAVGTALHLMAVAGAYVRSRARAA